MIHDARRIPDSIARAVRLAYSGRRGPVHLTIPVDIQEQELDDNEVVFFNPDEYRASEAILAPQAQIQQVIDLLRQAQRPFVIAGEAAGYTQDGQALMDFAETAKVPVLTEGQARGLVPDDHPYGFGFF
jgi:acetolactate synthase-1/2/3 large subunit